MSTSKNEKASRPAGKPNMVLCLMCGKETPKAAAYPLAESVERDEKTGRILAAEFYCPSCRWDP